MTLEDYDSDILLHFYQIYWYYIHEYIKDKIIMIYPHISMIMPHMRL